MYMVLGGRIQAEQTHPFENCGLKGGAMEIALSRGGHSLTGKKGNQ